MLYIFASKLLFIYYHIFFRLRVSGKENIPKDGPVIICSNHISNNDPLVLGASFKRPIHFMAKQEMFSNKLFAFILKKVNAFPLKRGATDLSSYKNALEVLDKGNMLGIFAQGHRLKEIEAKDAKTGVALFALKSGATVVPVKISSKYRPFGKIQVSIGKPVEMEEFKGQKVRSGMLKELTTIIMENISSL